MSLSEMSTLTKEQQRIVELNALIVKAMEREDGSEHVLMQERRLLWDRGIRVPAKQAVRK